MRYKLEKVVALPHKITYAIIAIVVIPRYFTCRI